MRPALFLGGPRRAALRDELDELAVQNRRDADGRGDALSAARNVELERMVQTARKSGVRSVPEDRRCSSPR